MNSLIDALTEKIGELEAELDAEIGKRRAQLHVGLEKGRAVFEEEILRRHRELKRGVAAYILTANPLVILTAPVIYSVIVPLVLLDLFVTVYQLVLVMTLLPFSALGDRIGLKKLYQLGEAVDGGEKLQPGPQPDLGRVDLFGGQ